MYVFDTLPIFLVCVLYNIWFPGMFIKHLGFRLPKTERQVYSDIVLIGSEEMVVREA